MKVKILLKPSQSILSIFEYIKKKFFIYTWAFFLIKIQFLELLSIGGLAV